MTDFNQTLRLNPNHALAYKNRGRVYFDRKDYDKAIADFEKAMQLDPNEPESKQFLQQARQLRGR